MSKTYKDNKRVTKSHKANHPRLMRDQSLCPYGIKCCGFKIDPSNARANEKRIWKKESH